MDEVISLLERFILNFEDELNEEQVNYAKAILETAKKENATIQYHALHILKHLELENI